MKKRKRTEIRFEVEQTLVVRQRRAPIVVWCEWCREQVTMIRPEDATATAGLTPRAIYRLVEAGRLHFIETADGSLLICLNSIRQEAVWSEPPREPEGG